MESKDRKRPREDDKKNNGKSLTGENDGPPPPYGSKAYWEDRYKKLKESKNEEVDPDPFHAWYFNYEELAPILLPLILGEGEGDGKNSDDDDEENEDGSDGENDDRGKEEQTTISEEKIENKHGRTSSESEHINGKSTKKHKEASDKLEGDKYEKNGEGKTKEAIDKKKGGSDENEDESEGSDAEERDDDDDDELEEVSDPDSFDDQDEVPKRTGLAKNGPISILEIGCGDVPLGRDIAKGIQELESAAGMEAANILKQVVCTDYSEVVIKAMQEEKEACVENWKLAFPLIYEIADARDLSYPDKSFELLIEKGTMDAMLSDVELGVENCKKIVSECSRVLTTGGTLAKSIDRFGNALGLNSFLTSIELFTRIAGYFVIVSHLNAHSQKGLQWLDDIVVPGLRKGGENCKWHIEVHGNDIDSSSDQGNEKDDDSTEESHGPAVYVIQKGPVPPEMDEKDAATDPPAIDLRYFSY